MIWFSFLATLSHCLKNLQKCEIFNSGKDLLEWYIIQSVASSILVGVLRSYFLQKVCIEVSFLLFSQLSSLVDHL